uniref:Capsid protein n=1 Tax=uncultured prokaryote TaxID=198431 RepID=A0A0H5Q542_9ZZZZ|nr:hypothetical protein [uncultured prokaryote]
MTTNYANASYQEVIDLHTESNTISVVGIHTPSTTTPRRMLSGFWKQFRKFKYNGCSFSLVPAARLPADPLQVSYEAGEPTIDPRDMLNPIMFHGCHGDNLGAILNQFYVGANQVATGANGTVMKENTDSLDVSVMSAGENSQFNSPSYAESLYYRALTDNTWKKAHPQAGFRKSGLRPLVHRVVSNVPYGAVAPDVGPGYVQEFSPSAYGDNAEFTEDGARFGTNIGEMGYEASSTDPYAIKGIGMPNSPVSSYDTVSGQFTLRRPITHTPEGFFTNKLENLGWMDTYSIHTKSIVSNSVASADLDKDMFNPLFSDPRVNIPTTVPKLFMGMILMPPAYKTEQYYRLIINHNFSFSGFRGASMLTMEDDLIGDAPATFNLN